MTLFSEMTVLRICVVCRMNWLNAKPGGSRNRPHHAIYLKLKGQTTYHDAKGQYVCDPEHIVFLPKGADYTVSFDHPGECFRVEFDTVETLTDIRSIPVKNPLELINTFIRLENLWLFKKDGYLPRAMSELYSLLAQLHALSVPVYAPAERQRKLEPAMRYLEAHYDDPGLRIDQLAGEAGVSEAYFRRLFSEVFHISPGHYIRNVRIEKAKALLTSEFGAIEDVAAAVGFTNIYHFSRTFRLVTGETPSAYARKY